MTDKETAEHLRKWCSGVRLPSFGWPTDGCGYEQHMRFVEHRNRYFHGGGMSFREFVLAYADRLDAAVLP